MGHIGTYIFSFQFVGYWYVLVCICCICLANLHCALSWRLRCVQRVQVSFKPVTEKKSACWHGGRQWSWRMWWAWPEFLDTFGLWSRSTCLSLLDQWAMTWAYMSNALSHWQGSNQSCTLTVIFQTLDMQSNWQCQSACTNDGPNAVPCNVWTCWFPAVWQPCCLVSLRYWAIQLVVNPFPGCIVWACAVLCLEFRSRNRSAWTKLVNLGSTMVLHCLAVAYS